MINIMIIII